MYRNAIKLHSPSDSPFRELVVNLHLIIKLTDKRALTSSKSKIKNQNIALR